MAAICDDTPTAMSLDDPGVRGVRNVVVQDSSPHYTHAEHFFSPSRHCRISARRLTIARSALLSWIVCKFHQCTQSSNGRGEATHVRTHELVSSSFYFLRKKSRRRRAPSSLLHLDEYVRAELLVGFDASAATNARAFVAFALLTARA